MDLYSLQRSWAIPIQLKPQGSTENPHKTSALFSLVFRLHTSYHHNTTTKHFRINLNYLVQDSRNWKRKNTYFASTTQVCSVHILGLEFCTYQLLSSHLVAFWKGQLTHNSHSASTSTQNTIIIQEAKKQYLMLVSVSMHCWESAQGHYCSRNQFCQE